MMRGYNKGIPNSYLINYRVIIGQLFDGRVERISTLFTPQHKPLVPPSFLTHMVNPNTWYKLVPPLTNFIGLPLAKSHFAKQSISCHPYYISGHRPLECRTDHVIERKRKRERERGLPYQLASDILWSSRICLFTRKPYLGTVRGGATDSVSQLRNLFFFLPLHACFKVVVGDKGPFLSMDWM